MHEFLLQHTTIAPFILFGLILLAGLNIPISIDVLLVVTSILAATIYPDSAIYLFLTFLMACIFSAWISYWLGRLVGTRLTNISWLSWIISKEKIQKMELFHKKFGFFAFLFGRFIPFGVRNCLFMSTGISKVPFWRFAIYDSIACTIWASSFFYLLFNLSQNYDQLIAHVKLINLFIFGAFSVTVIIFFCYKVRKRNQSAQ